MFAGSLDVSRVLASASAVSHSVLTKPGMYEDR
jgi:hypothetical protein